MNTIGPSEEISRRMARPSVVLPEPGFADHAERFALAQIDADAVDRLDMADDFAHQAALDRKPDFEVGRLQNHRRIGLRRGRVGLRLGGKKRARYRGAPGAVKTRSTVALLDDLAFLHHADLLRDLAHDAEVVGDEQQRHAEPLLDVLQQLDDLRLHGDVERGGRLVGDEQIGLVGERHGDHDALALAAGKLMRIAAEPALRVGDADLGQHLERPRARCGAGEPAMQQQNLADLLVDGVQRIERGHRLLEDDGDVVAAHAAHLALGEREQVAAIESDAARKDATPPDRAGV